MSTTNLDQLFDLAREHAERVLVGAPKERQLMPIWHLVPERGDEMVIMTPFDCETAKMIVLAQLRDYMREKAVVRYVFITEAWAVRTTKEEYAKDKRPPSERDNRVEIVQIVGAERGGEGQGRAFEIVRDWTTGQVTELKPLDQSATQMSGRFANLLEDA